MAGRRSVWSNEKIIAEAEHFVPVTDEVWRLQRGTDAECRHFQKMADQGHYKAEGGTRQGIYVMTAGGKLLASINTRNGEDVLKMMLKGLEAWKQTTKADRTLPEGFTLPRKRWEDSFPGDGLILRSWNVDFGSGADRARRNVDHVWFSAKEARGWIGNNLEVGATHEVSKAIVERLVRFHLVDNIRGQTLPFMPEEVGACTITTTVTVKLTEETRTLVVFEIKGSTAAKSDGKTTFEGSDWKYNENHPRSVRTRIYGSGVYDASSQKIDRLEFVAVGTRIGRTHLNGRTKNDIGPAGIGFYFEKTATVRIPPAFIDIYGADWVVDPR